MQEEAICSAFFLILPEMLRAKRLMQSDLEFNTCCNLNELSFGRRITICARDTEGERNLIKWRSKVTKPSEWNLTSAGKVCLGNWNTQLNCVRELNNYKTLESYQISCSKHDLSEKYSKDKSRGNIFCSVQYHPYMLLSEPWKIPVKVDK